MDEKIKKTVEVLQNNGVVILPTDTVYGIFTVPGNEEGIERIFKMKNRPLDKPLALLIPEIKYVWKWVDKTTELQELCSKYWPGPTTLVMRTRQGEPIGLRMPDYEPVLEIMKITGPLCATSANISGTIAPATIKDIPKAIRDACDLVVDFQLPPTGKPSQVLDVISNKTKIIRE